MPCVSSPACVAFVALRPVWLFLGLFSLRDFDGFYDCLASGSCLLCFLLLYLGYADVEEYLVFYFIVCGFLTKIVE